MKKIIKVYLLTLLFLCVSQANFAQNDVPSTPEAKCEALLTPQYYTNWIGASFCTISTIEHELDVTPVKITGLTFFYDFGSCFVGMEANEKGVVTQMTLRLFGGQANDFIQKAKDYGYELFDKGKNLVIHSNTGELLPDLYESKVKVYRKETKNGKVYMEVGNSERVANEYQIAIYRTMK